MKILVIAEKDSKDLTALHRAIAMSQNENNTIDLIGFVHAAGVDSSDLLSEAEKKKVRQKLIDEKSAWLDKKLSSIDTSSIKLAVDTVWQKTVHEWVTDRCKQKPYDLVIKTGNRSENFTYTPTDWHLIRSCPAPVMIVSSKKWKSKNCILATLDLGTEDNKKVKLNQLVIEQAKALSEKTGQDIVYFYCIDLPRVIADLEIVDDIKLKKQAKEKAYAHLTQYYGKYKIDKKQIKIARGSSETAIIKAAKKEHADMVVLGTIGRKGLKGKLIGNTAENVLSGLDTDVLTLKL